MTLGSITVQGQVVNYNRRCILTMALFSPFSLGKRVLSMALSANEPCAPMHGCLASIAYGFRDVHVEVNM